MKAIEVPLSEGEYERLTDRYALTPTGTRWEALREAVLLPGCPSGWKSGYSGLVLSVRTLEALDSRREHHPRPVTDTEAEEGKVLAEIKAAMQSHDVSLHLVNTFTHGQGVQVMIKSRKVGPILFPPDGQTIADTLSMLGGMVNG